MDKIFYPNSVAVIGVSEKPDNLAAGIVRNLGAFGFEGDVHLVGRREGKLNGTPILPSVAMLPTDVDLAVILTPAATIPELLEACGRKGIRRAVIESAGFSEFSQDGGMLEEQVKAVARRWSIRFVGPNCVSVVNMANKLCLPFARLDPEGAKAGAVSVLAQSGGVSITYLVLLSESGLGANKVVSMGNKTDLDEIDYLTYLLDDPGTEIICLYLESIEKGRRLLDIASSSTKPVIIQKANRSDASAQIAFSHTAALANDDAIVDAALRQTGVARADSFDEAVAFAQGFTLPPVSGNDLLVISRSGGHAVVAADEAERHGFRLMPIPEAFAKRVRQMFRADVIAPTNPLDLGAIFDFDLYGRIVEESLSTLDPHAVLLVQTYSPGPETTMSERLARRLQGLTTDLQKPLAFCAFAHQGQIDHLRLQVDLPVFTEIESAVAALAASRDRHRAARRLLPLPSNASQRPDKVQRILARPGTLTAERSLDLCASFGIPVADCAVAKDEKSALSAARALGYPVALKGLTSRVSHKSDAGLVALDLTEAEELRAAFRDISQALRVQDPQAHTTRVMVQPMVFGGLEVIVGGKRDPSFGPIVMFGLGGICVETVRDVVFRLAPLRREEAKDMLGELRASRLLADPLGEAPVDQESIIDCLLSISDLLLACPEVIEIEVNPYLALEHGGAAIDARALLRGQRA